MLLKGWDEVWVAVKFQTSLEMLVLNLFRGASESRILEVEHCLDEGLTWVTDFINSECQ